MNSRRRWMNGVNPCIYYSLTAEKILIQLKGTLSWSPVKLKRQSMDDYIQHLRNFRVIESTMLYLTAENIRRESKRCKVKTSLLHPWWLDQKGKWTLLWWRGWGGGDDLEKWWGMDSGGELAEKWVLKLAQLENLSNIKLQKLTQETCIRMENCLEHRQVWPDTFNQSRRILHYKHRTVVLLT